MTGMVGSQGKTMFLECTRRAGTRVRVDGSLMGVFPADDRGVGEGSDKTVVCGVELVDVPLIFREDDGFTTRTDRRQCQHAKPHGTMEYALA